MLKLTKSLPATVFIIVFIVFAGSHNVQARIISPDQYVEMIKNYSNEELKQEFLRTSYALKAPTPTKLKQELQHGIEPDIAMAQSYEYKKALFKAVKKEMQHRGLLTPKHVPDAVEPIDPELIEPLMP